MYYITKYASPIGTLTLACASNNCDENKLVGLWIDGQKYHGFAKSETTSKNNDIAVFRTAKNWLDRYFAGQQPAISELPLAPIGSEFRREVWRILCEIPYGKVSTYGDIAAKTAKIMNKKCMSSQAVGGAVGHNPISIIIPCHRVVGSNGSLTGYAGGIQTKIKLLELEGTDMSRLFVPAKGTAL